MCYLVLYRYYSVLLLFICVVLNIPVTHWDGVMASFVLRKANVLWFRTQLRAIGIQAFNLESDSLLHEPLILTFVSMIIPSKSLYRIDFRKASPTSDLYMDISRLLLGSLLFSANSLSIRLGFSLSSEPVCLVEL